MSEAEAVRFIEAINNDEALRAEFEALADHPEIAVKRVGERGFNCTPEEIRNEFLASIEGSLTAEQLEQIAAGISKQTTGAIVGGLWAGVGIVAIAAASVAAA
ncbi:MAG: Nif11 domain [Actinomycetota bacterium]|jgi:predicted ribosomally synthesized peptide with nif11-like leader